MCVFCYVPSVKMSRPQVEVTAFSDHLLVKWIRSVSSETCHCQVKYDKVCPTLATKDPKWQRNIYFKKVWF